MKKSFWPVLVLAAALPLSAAGCANCATGDPNRGGLLCWREDMAIKRQDGLKRELEREKQEGAKQQSEKARLQRQINAKQKELEVLKGKSQAAGPSAAEAEEISRLEKEIKQLQLEHQILMDL
jgi:septal ring factor EnvC (AmiA/AmiB activator)